MATRYFVPGGANQLSSTSNWSTVRWGSTGSAAPTTGDDAYLMDGTGELSSTGIDQMGLAALTSITFGPEFAMSAPAGSVIGARATTVNVESVSQHLPISVVSGVTTMKVRPRGGLVSLSGTTITSLYLLGGNVNLLASLTTPTAMYAGGRNLNVWAEYNATAFTACEFYLGRFLSNRGFTTLSQFGEEATTRMIIKASSLAVNMGTWNLHGGFAKYASNGTITALNARRGLWTPRGAPGNPTITDSTFYGSNDNVTVVNKVGNIEVTFTNATTKVGDAAGVPDSMGAMGE